MAAIKHKLRTRLSSGAPLAFSARAGVVAEDIRKHTTPPDLPPVACYQGKKLASTQGRRGLVEITAGREHVRFAPRKRTLLRFKAPARDQRRTKPLNLPLASE
jgi:hypothetical protein